MKSEVLEYQGFSLCKITGSEAADIPEATSDKYYRIELPYKSTNYEEMANKGYAFVDRTLGVAINLKRNETDYAKMVRFEIKHVPEINDEIRGIALHSFPNDRRFHIRPVPDGQIAAIIINRWLDELSEVYVCTHKDQIVGFLDLEPYGEKDCFIHLAAVTERYRAAGAAVSLYAFAIQKAKEKGCEKIHGRISSGNTAVMNLYAKLGGVFSDPVDVFVRNEI